jgi:hypothetical protein
MKLKPLILLVVLTASLLAVYLFRSKVSFLCHREEKCILKKMNESPVLSDAFWSQPTVNHLEVIEYLKLQNIKDGLAARPTLAQSVDLPRVFEEVLQSLPENLRDKLKRKLLGVVFVENLGSTAYTERVFSEEGSIAGSFCVFDIKVLSQAANEWATYKESTVFENGDYRINVEIEDPLHPEKFGAAKYIFLHELAHVLSAGESFEPDWNEPPALVGSLVKYPFAHISWAIDVEKNRYIKQLEQDRSILQNLKFYGDTKIENSSLIGIYKRLGEAEFISLYAATSPFEDFAESFAHYIHTELLKKPPPRITVKHNGAQKLELIPSWDEGRFAKKRSALEKIFAEL